MAEAAPKRTVWTRALSVADRTPESRNRLIDFLRVFSITIVVFGHWLAAAPYEAGGELTLSHVLDIGDSGIHYLTWLLQIMPIFFMVGGYSNAKSLSAAQRKGTKRRTWLAARYVRLVTPIVPFLIVWSVLVPIFGGFVDLELLKLGSQVAAVPLWFLAVYLLAVALAPWTFRAWQRWRWKTLWVPVFIAVAFDILRVNPDWFSWATYPSWTNYIWVWLTVHQIGYAWAERDGELAPKTGWAVTGVGLAGLIGLTVFGPFPVPLIGVEGEAFSNTTPPSIVLFAQTLVQIGLISVVGGASQALVGQQEGVGSGGVGERHDHVSLRLAPHRHGVHHRDRCRSRQPGIRGRTAHRRVVGDPTGVVCRAHGAVAHPRGHLRSVRTTRPERRIDAETDRAGHRHRALRHRPGIVGCVRDRPGRRFPASMVGAARPDCRHVPDRDVHDVPGASRSPALNLPNAAGRAVR